MRNYVLKSMLLLLISLPTLATEIIHYSNLPVTIQLHKGQERSIQFGSHVQVGVTRGQQAKQLFRVQSAQGAIHLLAYEAFDKQRVQVRRMSDGQVILLDLIAEDSDETAAPLENLRIVLASDNVVAEEDMAASMPEKRKHITPVDLTRHAAQRLYGPTRLHHDIPGITETSLGVKGAVRVFKGSARYTTLTRPVAAYAGGGYFLAAMHIRNVSDDPVQLDYLDLNLPFSHATFQHHSLRPKGTPGDSTVLYLISEKPLKETLYPWTYYQDLKREAEESVSE